MIPKNISSLDVLKAIEKVKIEGYDAGRNSSEYDLYFEEMLYPPKVIISYANIFANEVELSSDDFSGGDESNDFLIQLGFPILCNNSNNPEHRFTREETAFFGRYADQPYHSSDAIHRNAGAFINEYIWRRSKEWADRIAAASAFERRGKIRWNERRNNGTGQAFKHYSWYQLHHREHYHEKIFYTVGIEGQRHPDYLRSQLVIKLDCKRSKMDELAIVAFDALLRENGINWEFIQVPDRGGLDWQELVSRSLTYIQSTFDIYMKALKQLEISTREMAARITWNSNAWQSPSGRAGKSQSRADSHEKNHGYTPEEWLLDLEKTIDGYHYARMESLNAAHHVGKRYNLTLFASNWDERQWYWVGRIRDAEVIDRDTSEAVTNEYRQLGWLDQQIWQLGQLDNVNVQNYSDWENANRFNVRFRPEGFQSYDLNPFADGETPPSGHYNLPTLKSAPMFLSDEADESEDELVYGSEEKEAPGRKIRKKYTSQVKELENVHRHVQTGFAEFLRRTRPHGHKIYTESYKKKSRTRIDIVELTADAKRIFYEVKTYPSSRYSIRMALGQLLEYAYFPSQNWAHSLVIVSHLPASPEELRFLTHLENELQIKLDYICYDWEKGIVI